MQEVNDDSKRLRTMFQQSLMEKEKEIASLQEKVSALEVRSLEHSGKRGEDVKNDHGDLQLEEMNDLREVKEKKIRFVFFWKRFMFFLLGKCFSGNRAV